MEQLDFFPEEAEAAQKEKERRKNRPVNIGEINRRRAVKERKKWAKYHLDIIKKKLEE